MNQAEALNSQVRSIEREKRAIFNKLMEVEGEVVAFLTWVDAPSGQKVIGAFADFKDKILRVFKANKWTEAEGRGIAFLLQFVDILPEMKKDAEKKLNAIRARQAKESESHGKDA
jgi:thioesterase domain-containing protein